MKREPFLCLPLWRRVLFHRAMTHLSAALVLSAIVSGLYLDRAYFMFASCAAGVILMARAWFEYCRFTDPRARKKREKPPVPYMLKKVKTAVRHRPACLMNAGDFDDDLTPDTVIDEEMLSDRQKMSAHIAALVLSGGVMLLLSFII